MPSIASEYFWRWRLFTVMRKSVVDNYVARQDRWHGRRVLQMIFNYWLSSVDQKVGDNVLVVHEFSFTFSPYCHADTDSDVELHD